MEFPEPVIEQGQGFEDALLSGPPIHEIVLILALIVVAGIILYPLAKALARRIEGGKPAISGASDARMERLEQAVDAMAVEIERISEGQRYATKLLTERLPSARDAQEKLPR